jgi:hypothetical protein
MKRRPPLNSLMMDNAMAVIIQVALAWPQTGEVGPAAFIAFLVENGRAAFGRQLA